MARSYVARTYVVRTYVARTYVATTYATAPTLQNIRSIGGDPTP